MNKYEQLTKDLTEALEEARKVGENTDDGGTCNTDMCLVLLPRWNEEKTIEAIEAAGTHGVKFKFFGKSYFSIGNPLSVQGNARSAQAEKIEEIMKAKGYETFLYSAMD